MVRWLQACRSEPLAQRGHQKPGLDRLPAGRDSNTGSSFKMPVFFGSECGRIETIDGIYCRRKRIESLGDDANRVNPASRTAEDPAALVPQSAGLHRAIERTFDLSPWRRWTRPSETGVSVFT